MVHVIVFFLIIRQMHDAISTEKAQKLNFMLVASVVRRQSLVNFRQVHRRITHSPSSLFPKDWKYRYVWQILNVSWKFQQSYQLQTKL